MQLQLLREAVGHLDDAGELGVADDDHAVGDEGGPPVAAGRADRQQVDRDDGVAVVGQQPLKALDALDASPRPAPA